MLQVPGWSKRITPLPFIVQMLLESAVSPKVTGLLVAPPVAVGEYVSPTTALGALEV